MCPVYQIVMRNITCACIEDIHRFIYALLVFRDRRHCAFHAFSLGSEGASVLISEGDWSVAKCMDHFSDRWQQPVSYDVETRTVPVAR